MAFSYTLDKRFLIASGVWVSMGTWTSGGDQTGEIDCQLSYVYNIQLTYNESATGGVAAAPTVEESLPGRLDDSMFIIDFERNRDGCWIAFGRP
jgi:hypothetical protein